MRFYFGVIQVLSIKSVGLFLIYCNVVTIFPHDGTTDSNSCNDKCTNAKSAYDDASYLHRQKNIFLMQKYTKSGRLLIFLSLFLLPREISIYLVCF